MIQKFFKKGDIVRITEVGITDGFYDDNHVMTKQIWKIQGLEHREDMTEDTFYTGNLILLDMDVAELRRMCKCKHYFNSTDNLVIFGAVRLAHYVDMVIPEGYKPNSLIRRG